MCHSLFGVTTLDVVRANKFVGDALGRDPSQMNVTVIGGHAGTTILPILSEFPELTEEQIEALTHRIQFGGDEVRAFAAAAWLLPKGSSAPVADPLHCWMARSWLQVVQAKNSLGSATLSMAFAGARFATSLADALNGATGVTECAFVESDKVDGCAFFSTRVSLGKDGVDTIHDVPQLSAFEQQGLEAMKGDLAKQIQKGVDFVKA